MPTEPPGEHYLLDTSAVFAFTDQEPGADRVEALLRRAGREEIELSLSALSLTELYCVTFRADGEAAAAQLVALVKHWPLQRISPTEKDLLLAGRLKALHRLSFADAVIAATAANCDATLVHKDPELQGLHGQLSLLALPFKGSA